MAVERVVCVLLVAAALTCAASDEMSILYSIVVPAYKEVDNLQPLIKQVFEALTKANLAAKTEMIIVDDNSRDGSEERVNELAKAGYNARIIVRTTERGLSSAVMHGFRQARGRVLACMDADLQHPPESVPSLLRAIDDGERPADTACVFAIGTRYGPGTGAIDPNWPLYRRVISSGARLLARPLTSLSDPMTGFFAINRAVFEAHVKEVNPIGFKIAMELYVKCGVRKHAEVPIVFGVRTAGYSKLTSKVMIGYLRHLAELYIYRPPVLFFLFLLLLFFLAFFIARKFIL